MESRANGAKDNENVGESQSKEPDGVVDNGEEPQNQVLFQSANAPLRRPATVLIMPGAASRAPASPSAGQKTAKVRAKISPVAAEISEKNLLMAHRMAFMPVE